MIERKNLRTGVRWGVGYAVGFSLLAFVIMAFHVIRIGVGQWQEALPVLAMVVGSYFVAGLCSGALVGALLPFGRRKLGAALLGFVGTLPAYGIVGMIALPMDQWWPLLPAVTIACAVVVGPISGYLIWRDEHTA